MYKAFGVKKAILELNVSVDHFNASFTDADALPCCIAYAIAIRDLCFDIVDVDNGSRSTFFFCM